MSQRGRRQKNLCTLSDEPVAISLGVLYSTEGNEPGRPARPSHAPCRATRIYTLIQDERTVSCPGGVPACGQPASAQVQGQAVHPELPMGAEPWGRFHIVEKETGQVVRTARSRAVFAFHHVNAFEEGDEIVVDIVAFRIQA
jgi:carotenoid cleavage dioxygenase-like enzyme